MGFDSRQASCTPTNHTHLPADPHPQLAALLPHHLAVLDDMNRTLVDSIVSFVA